MGGYFSKIGSDPYYANYEKSFQRLKKDIDRLNVISALQQQMLVCHCKSSKCVCVLQVQTETRLKTRKGLAHFIAVWGTALFVVIVLFAAWVSSGSDTVFNTAPLKQQMTLGKGHPSCRYCGNQKAHTPHRSMLFAYHPY